MNLLQLQELGAFVGGTVAKEVTWKGNTFTVHVARLSFGETEMLMSQQDIKEQPARAAKFISAAIRLGDDAAEALTYEQAYGLDVALASEFIRVANEVATADREKN